MSIFKSFEEIENDSDRKTAIETYFLIINQEKITESLDKSELRTDIVTSYNHPHSMWADDYIY